MKNVIAIFIAFLSFTATEAQVIYLSESPAPWNQQVTLYIDVNLSGDDINSLKEILIAHPESLNDVHIWIWQPCEPNGGNGSWTNSNESLIMTWENELLFSFTFVPSSLFGCTEDEFNSLGISCLAKLDNGLDFIGEFSGEPKTEDLHIETSTFITETSSSEFFNLFPNPSNHVCQIQSSGTEVFAVEVFDLSGKLILLPELKKGTYTGMKFFHLNDLSSGVYFVRIRGKNSTSIQKLIVENH
jgi:hypothetical protein